MGDQRIAVFSLGTALGRLLCGAVASSKPAVCVTCWESTGNLDGQACLLKGGLASPPHHLRRLTVFPQNTRGRDLQFLESGCY